uniref:NADH-ubiquinone oxidoreductase chain 6 n=1 Tax=Cherax cairnsensis TaxID=220736 RepID=W6MV16_9EUCA|nr:NADH dehydrogenase subunit 6 [Cherax cairnsensis]CDL72652.1 NADH dehydrogenase subunit 6 [Cherax cairnsensis]
MFYNILYFIIPSIISTAILFTTLTHPLSMGLTLLIQTVLICILTGLFNPSFWFSYILFLIFLGGMLILFIYVSSLASNEPFKMSLSLILMMSLSVLLTLPFILLDPMLFTSKFYNSSVFLFLNNKINPIYLTTSTIYSSPSTFLTIFMISYLLLTLIVVVKIINISSSPLRPMKN